MPMVHRLPHEFQPDMTDEEYRQSVERARCDTKWQRVKHGADPETGFIFPKRVPAPVPPRRVPMDKVVDCHMALNPVVLQFGLSTVLRCLVMTCEANGISIKDKTIEELMQGDEH